MQRFSTAPHKMIDSLWCNRGLILALTKREVVGRYRGSFLGTIWSLLNPILMLAVYTFFFSVIFKARWPGGTESKTEFALILFAGLLIFNFFAECIGKAPTLIVGNVNYVKKVIFPLEILPFVLVGAAGFHFFANLIVWLVFYVLFLGVPTFHSFYLALILIPLVLLTLGVCWVLASLGVYLRDVGQVITAIIPGLMFISPVFYSIDTLPQKLRVFFQLNPLTFLIEQTREVLIFHKGIAWNHWLLLTALSLIFAWSGYVWFQKTRKGFADVL